MLRINKIKLDYLDQKVNALCFIPNENINKKSIAIFCHGYTSHKGSLLNWATRLTENGIITLIFDLPGHYLGSFCEVKSFDYFCHYTPYLFQEAFNYIQSKLALNLRDDLKIILGGHSLGALISLKALELNLFKNLSTISILVGLGKLAEHQNHIFQSPFYKDILNIRAELVSKEISPEKIFPWIASEKNTLNLSKQTLHFITGKNDLIVGEFGTERFIEMIHSNNNISFNKVDNLPHHLPEMAASYIKKYLKQINIL